MEKQKHEAYDSEGGIRREGLPLLSRMEISFQGKTGVCFTEASKVSTVLLQLQVDARFMDVARASRSCPAGLGRRRREQTLPRAKATPFGRQGRMSPVVRGLGEAAASPHENFPEIYASVRSSLGSSKSWRVGACSISRPR